jgi:hypothetical protein
MTNKSIKDYAPYIAVLAAIGAAAAAATIAYVRTSKALKELGNFDLDFGNDPGVISMFNRKEKNEE